MLVLLLVLQRIQKIYKSNLDIVFVKYCDLNYIHGAFVIQNLVFTILTIRGPENG